MRGDDEQPDSMFSYVSPEQRVPKDHPLRAIRQLVDEILREMSRDFDKRYASVGRPSIPPERLLRAQLLQIFYSIRSERLLMEQLDYNILFRWFVGLAMDEPIWDATVFTKNRDRLLNQDLARGFLRRVVARAEPYMSGQPEEFSAEGRPDGRRRPPFSWRVAHERHPRLEDRPGRETVPPLAECRRAAGLSGPPRD
jgi:transposase